MKFSFFLTVLVALVLSACATRQVPMDPSVYLLSTDKDPNWLLEQIKKDLEENKYQTDSLDFKSGILVMEPRTFVILRDEERASGKQYLQVRQEGGSVKLTMTYDCDYPEGTKTCFISDADAQSKIRRVEKLIMSMINRRLFKKPGEDRVKSKEI